MQTREFINGRYVTVQDDFRGYRSPGESSTDYVNFLRSNRRYRPVLGARTFEEAVAAMGASGYATDPWYASKLRRLSPKTPEQAEFLNARRSELMGGGLPPHLAELGARQSALETGWGRSLSGGNNYYGIKQHGADVRMASADSELPPEMQMPGDPATGQAPAMQLPGNPATGQARMSGSLPPELGDTPFGAQMYQSLMAEQEAQKPSFGERLAADPFFQMGAAILGAPGRGGNFMAAVGQGMSQGLKAAQAAEAARRETQHNQIRNRLWMEQLNNERFRLLGGEQPTPFEQGQMRYWEGQNASKMRELDLRERGVYASPTESSAPKAPAGYKWTPEGNQTFIPGGPADPETKAALKGDSGGGKGGQADVGKIDQALSQIDYMEKNLVDPEDGAFQEISSGLGGIGRLAQTAAQGLRNIYNQWLPDPKNPSTMTAEVYRRQLSTLAGTLAKANGDTGTLSEGDIKRALDAMPQPDAWPDSRQMAKLLIGNLRQVLAEKKQAASERTGSLPPETVAAPPSGIPSGWSVEVE